MTTYERLASFERCENIANGYDLTGCQISACSDTNSSERSRTPPIPEGTRPLQLQVAGHVFGRANGQKKNKIGFLQSDDGTVLKPVLDRKGLREVHFYELLSNLKGENTVLRELREFVPKFMGIWTTPVHPGQSYIKLEDVTCQFQKPSVMDVKVGPITYDCEADEAKRFRESEKFPALKKIGFQIVGIKRYDMVTDSYCNIERTFLRTLNEETILTEGLARYLCSRQLVSAFLQRLQAIESWFCHQSSYCFIASSLLFLYDSEALYRRQRCVEARLEHKQGINNNGKFDDIADVRVIDLTHVFPIEGPDLNYLTGIRSLITYLTKLELQLVTSDS